MEKDETAKGEDIKPSINKQWQVKVDGGVTAWEHVPGVPHFEFEQHAREVMMELYKLKDHG